jgi:Putative auto-transporter adhesin, head GIN domain
MKYIKSHIAFFIYVWTVLFFGCSKEESYRDFKTEEKTVAPFHTIEINGVFDIYLVQDTFCGIRFEGENRILKQCSAISTDSVLTIENPHKGALLRPHEKNMIIYIHFNGLKRMNANEVCHIRCVNEITGYEIGLVVGTRQIEADFKLNCTVFYYWNNPNGTHLNLTGQVDQLKLWNTGLSGIDASQLTARYVLMENGSQIDAKIRATEQLDYSLTNTGNIRYYGNPSVLRPLQTTGTGQLIKAD